MKRSYYIIPVVLLAGFIFLYVQHSGELEQKKAAAVAEKARVDAEEAAKKAAQAKKAKDDADRRMAEREAEERKKEADKRAKYDSEIAKIKASTDKYTQDLNRFTKLTTDKETELKALRAEKEKLNRESYDMAKKVEQTKIDKRTAELEIQRYADMVAKKALESSLVKPPVTATTAATP